MSEKIDKKIKEIYSLKSNSFMYRNKTNFSKDKVGSPVYGEITQKGTNDLIKHFKDYFNSETVFYDLGSGLSKMVIHIGLQYKIKKSVGIEYSKERHKGAIYLKEKYAKDLKNIEIICGDFIKQNIKDATVVYVDNTMYNSDFNKKIFDKIPKGCLFLFKSGLRAFPKNECKCKKDLVERTYKQNKICWILKK